MNRRKKILTYTKCIGIDLVLKKFFLLKKVGRGERSHFFQQEKL